MPRGRLHSQCACTAARVRHTGSGTGSAAPSAGASTNGRTSQPGPNRQRGSEPGDDGDRPHGRDLDRTGRLEHDRLRRSADVQLTFSTDAAT
jgi:hypothetical protein